ncbi:unnamed protein product [Closterium sp. NIES-64]|nr:unnamed protein product [Closterium sp. NIES-64]
MRHAQKNKREPRSHPFSCRPSLPSLLPSLTFLLKSLASLSAARIPSLFTSSHPPPPLTYVQFPPFPSRSSPPSLRAIPPSYPSLTPTAHSLPSLPHFPLEYPIPFPPPPSLLNLPHSSLYSPPFTPPPSPLSYSYPSPLFSSTPSLSPCPSIPLPTCPSLPFPLSFHPTPHLPLPPFPSVSPPFRPSLSPVSFPPFPPLSLHCFPPCPSLRFSPCPSLPFPHPPLLCPRSSSRPSPVQTFSPFPQLSGPAALHLAAPPAFISRPRRPALAAPPPYTSRPRRPAFAAPPPCFRGPAARLYRPRRPSAAALPPCTWGPAARVLRPCHSPLLPATRAADRSTTLQRAPEQPTAAPPSTGGAGPPSCRAARPPTSRASFSRAAQMPSSCAAEPPSSRAPSRQAAQPPSRPAAEPPYYRAARPALSAIDFEVWVDDLQLFLQCDRADGLSPFDLTSGASPALATDADPTVRSQWATPDAAARLAVRRHLPTAERAHFSQYKSAQTLDHFLSVCPTTLTVDLLEKAFLTAEKSIVAVGASRGDPCTPIFEGCSPPPLLPSVASAAATDLVGLESVGAYVGFGLPHLHT